MWNRTLDLLVGVITGVVILSVLHGWEADDSVTFTKEEPTRSTRTIKVGERLGTVIAVPGRYQHRYLYTPAPGSELKMEEFGERNGLLRELTTADFCRGTKPTRHPLVWDFKNACSRYTVSVVVGVGEAHKMPANQTNSIHRARPFGRYT
jgi:hypothetical protein